MGHRLGGYGFRKPREAFAQAKVAATRALELDDALPGAHAAIAFSRWLNDWDYAGAEQGFLRAVALGCHEAIHQYASLLSLMGRHREAIELCRQALTVNPFSSNVRWGLGMVYRMSGMPALGAEVLRSWLLIEPNDVQARFQLGLTLVELAEYPEAIEILEGVAAVRALRGVALGALAYARGRYGRREDGHHLLEELQGLASGDYPLHGWLAMGHMGLGEYEEALDALTVAVDMHDSWMPTYMSVEPAFVPLHTNPRFRRLLRLAGHAA